MVTWSRFPDDRSGEQWDEVLLNMPDQSIFQSSLWAEHKRATGWTPIRLMGREDNGTPRALLQCLAKNGPLGSTLLWSRGGPLGEHSCWGKTLREALFKTVGRPFSYLRICSYREQTPSLIIHLQEEGWKRPRTPLNRNLTFMLTLADDGSELLPRASKNWRHNLRRGNKRCRNILQWKTPQAAELSRVYRAMESYKGISQQHEQESLASLIHHLGDSLLLYRTDGPDGTPIALRACALQGNRAWDLLAANSPAGRKLYASYALLGKILADCRQRGVRSYDLGGADPATAKGVYDFKKGTGARPFEFIGEWDCARPALLRPLADLAIRFKK